MNNCIYCQSLTRGKVCMSKDCQNKKKTQHYHDNLEHYRQLKREESKRNYKHRASRKREQSVKKYYEDFISTILRYAKARAKEYSLPFNLDKDFIKQLYESQDKRCAITAIDFQFERANEKKKRRPFAPSLDRVDYSRGYTKDNVRLVCSIVNIALSDFGDEAFDKMCEAYVRNKHAC